MNLYLSKVFNLIVIFIFKKFKLLTYFFYIYLNFNSYSYAHMQGTFSSAEHASEKSLELGCTGAHKNQDKWLPCKNEKELHQYLRK